MERDRTAVLIRQAGFEGVIDFSKARPADPGWWRWLHGRLDLVHQQNLVRVYALQHAQNVAVIPGASAEGVQQHWDRANDLLVKTFNALFPWLKKDDAGDEFGEAVDALNQMWVEAWGDPNDPAVQDKIWATARALDPTLTKG